MNKYTLALCTPDSFRPAAKALAADLKKTNLAGCDLIILDNNYDNGFRHAESMNAVLDFAGDSWVVFIDDDVRIKKRNWLEGLIETADQYQADIVGCVHTYASGEVNHAGILVHDDGSPEMLRDLNPATAYVPALSSALMAINGSTGLRFDTGFLKYQHDIDICLSAWQRGLRVAIDSRTTVIHEMAGYYSTIRKPAVAYNRDAETFAQKWQQFAALKLPTIPELEDHVALSRTRNWSVAYNNASALQDIDPETATKEFAAILEDCPFSHLRAGACFHLYELLGDIDYLRNCIEMNPFHNKARELLKECSTDTLNVVCTPRQEIS